MNITVYLVTLFLKNWSADFDETLHDAKACTEEGLCKVSAHITHKQKIFINSPILTLKNGPRSGPFWRVLTNIP